MQWDAQLTIALAGCASVFAVLVQPVMPTIYMYADLWPSDAYHFFIYLYASAEARGSLNLYQLTVY